MIRQISFLAPFFVIFALSFFLYRESLNYYFFQDDWFVLNWVRTSRFLSYFAFRTDIIYWRPLSMPIFFSVSNYLFGLNPHGYHYITFVFHLINIFLVFYLFKNLKFSKNLALLAAFLYGTSPVHFISLSWLSTTAYVMGPTFILSSIIFFLKKRYYPSLLSFVMALLSTEFALITIPLIFILKKEKNIILLLFLTISFIYLFLRFVAFPLPRTNQYEIKIDINLVKTVFWYLLWSINFPERLFTLFFFSSPKQSIVNILPFIKTLILPTFLLSALTVLTIVKIKFSQIFFAVSWFLLALSPVLFLPKHTYPMYLPIAVLAVIYLLTLSVQNTGKFKSIFYSFLALAWFFSSYLTLSFTRQTHWVPNEQGISKAYIDYIKENNKNPQNNSMFLFKPATHDFAGKNNITIVETEKNIMQSLNDQDAMQVVYNDSSLKSVYITHQNSFIAPPNTKMIEVYPR